MSFERKWTPLVGAILMLADPAGAAQAGRPLSAAEARQEVRLVVDNLMSFHPDPFHETTRQAFFAEVATLLAGEGPVTAPEQFFRLARLLSPISDTHTQLHFTDDTPGFDTTYPLRFRLFPDGLYIIAGNEDYRDAIGKKVVTIAGHQATEVVDRFAHYSFADHWPRKRVFAEMLFYHPATYDFFDLRTARGTTELVVESSTGERATVELAATWDKRASQFGWDMLNPFIPDGLLTVHDVLGTEPPYYQRRIDDNVWFGFPAGNDRLMYLQINRQLEPEDGPESIDIILDWARTLWESAAEVLVIDLRNDPGGNIFLGDAISGILPELYVNHPTLKAVAVLFGTDTVSAGTILVAQLERTVQPVLIGDPSGSAPNMFLHAEKIVLPHSNIEFEVSREEYVTTRDLDTRRYIVPDVPMSLSFADFANGRDPLLDFAATIDDALAQKIYGAVGLDAWRRDSQRPALPSHASRTAAAR
ncbi:MAG TPA: hypothetical protein VD788_14510 [Candidatus Polarisedimenticolaceae bacterium]|nr:hypothetical protein [Candidatus Polarisedimenticolaceae bacterium]